MSKGAMWNKWDLHIHSPVTTSNNEFEGKNIEDKWDRYIEEIEKLDDVKVLGITDYYSIDGYLHMIDCQYKCNTLYLCCIKDLCRCFISETLAGSIIYYSNNSIKLFLTYRRKIKPFRIKLS